MDPFELLGLPRRPWLDPEEIRAAFQRRARTLHPDVAGGDAEAFAALNAAQRTLSSPAARLRVLVGQDGSPPPVPPDFAFGFRVGEVLRATDAALERWRTAANPLARAVARVQLQEQAVALESLNADLRERRAIAEAALRGVGRDDREALARLADAFTFLERWEAQIRERAVELRVAR